MGKQDANCCLQFSSHISARRPSVKQNILTVITHEKKTKVCGHLGRCFLAPSSNSSGEKSAAGASGLAHTSESMWFLRSRLQSSSSAAALRRSAHDGNILRGAKSPSAGRPVKFLEGHVRMPSSVYMKPPFIQRLQFSLQVKKGKGRSLCPFHYSSGVRE